MRRLAALASPAIATAAATRALADGATLGAINPGIDLGAFAHDRGAALGGALSVVAYVRREHQVPAPRRARPRAAVVGHLRVLRGATSPASTVASVSADLAV